MLSSFTKQNVYNVLKISAALCFIGHGAFGIITKPIWCNYFAVFGIGKVLAYKIMPFLGIADILMGISLLFYPTRFVLFWLVLWGFITAALRPLSGEAFPELIERAGNFGAPLIILMLSTESEKTIKSLFEKTKPAATINSRLLLNINYALRFIIFMLFLGHGWLNLVQKQGLIHQYISLGFSNPAHAAQFIGLLELVAALSVLIRPLSSLLIVLLLWKVVSELFYPHWEFFELVERAGSYGCIIALFLIQLPVKKLHDQLKLKRIKAF